MRIRLLISIVGMLALTLPGVSSGAQGQNLPAADASLQAGSPLAQQLYLAPMFMNAPPPPLPTATPTLRPGSTATGVTATSTALTPVRTATALTATPAQPQAPFQLPLFGLQPHATLADNLALTRTVELGVGWVRLAERVSWNVLQPEADSPIDWTKLITFERELRALKQAGIAPVVTVMYSPRWATINLPRPTSCGAIRDDKLAAFAAFMRQIVARYSTPAFDVHVWEIGNEIDVDPTLVPVDNGVGCWGDVNDPLYGGQRYGAMLKVVTPAIKAEDRRAQVWVGGLLLDTPLTTEKGRGRPELFLKGILAAGGGPFFDVLPYHAYTFFYKRVIDQDQHPNSAWHDLGGVVLGKASFLREIMRGYGLNKPLVIDELALGCNPVNAPCSPPPAVFYQVQASHVVRLVVRGLSGGMQGFSWYTLMPGWRNTELIDNQGNPRPVFFAYQQLIRQLEDAEYIGAVGYGASIEGYTFQRGNTEVQVLWTNEDTQAALRVPQEQLISAQDRDGNPLTGLAVGTSFEFQANFQPIYLTLRGTRNN